MPGFHPQPPKRIQHGGMLTPKQANEILDRASAVRQATGDGRYIAADLKNGTLNVRWIGGEFIRQTWIAVVYNHALVAGSTTQYKYSWYEARINGVADYGPKPKGRSGTVAGDYALNAAELTTATGQGYETQPIDGEGATAVMMWYERDREGRLRPTFDRLVCCGEQSSGSSPSSPSSDISSISGMSVSESSECGVCVATEMSANIEGIAACDNCFAVGFNSSRKIIEVPDMSLTLTGGGDTPESLANCAFQGDMQVRISEYVGRNCETWFSNAEQTYHVTVNMIQDVSGGQVVGHRIHAYIQIADTGGGTSGIAFDSPTVSYTPGDTVVLTNLITAGYCGSTYSGSIVVGTGGTVTVTTCGAGALESFSSASSEDSSSSNNSSSTSAHSSSSSSPWPQMQSTSSSFNSSSSSSSGGFGGRRCQRRFLQQWNGCDTWSAVTLDSQHCKTFAEFEAGPDTGVWIFTGTSTIGGPVCYWSYYTTWEESPPCVFLDIDCPHVDPEEYPAPQTEEPVCPVCESSTSSSLNSSSSQSSPPSSSSSGDCCIYVFQARWSCALESWSMIEATGPAKVNCTGLTLDEWWFDDINSNEFFCYYFFQMTAVGEGCTPDDNCAGCTPVGEVTPPTFPAEPFGGCACEPSSSSTSLNSSSSSPVLSSSSSSPAVSSSSSQSANPSSSSSSVNSSSSSSLNSSSSSSQSDNSSSSSSGGLSSSSSSSVGVSSSSSSSVCPDTIHWTESGHTDCSEFECSLLNGEWDLDFVASIPGLGVPGFYFTAAGHTLYVYYSSGAWNCYHGLDGVCELGTGCVVSSANTCDPRGLECSGTAIGDTCDPGYGGPIAWS